ncbi:initiation-specific alpha-1,6-mannosyltransferase [Colletotrichum higginsianum]|uniref:Initiation-specific alpha-1,6-mannosyltransferase n=1 Tax=Colletotrichum higginsianum (strain IMI 349063) TaxID=759273 RepID=H1UVU4_COLHI|nr:Initiation-specific alpha-1,6-mannosyltransferase [Colletotrichum higginsianum IMI 349063]OBR05666.1 Initiation-specific alpha-1,6-mannosyltransferase [Colletotrichum higginsianum IMI 349063]CCF32095.1 initiation-specific alpha-1,6-mannosyltransferase [Colletotrichum higginsianum]
MAQFTAENSMSTLLERAIYYYWRVRYRSRLVVGLALILLSGCWLYGNSGINSIGRGLFNDKFTTRKKYSTCDVNSRGSDWVKPRPGHSIPPKIWQIMLPKVSNDQKPVDPDTLTETKTWLAMNQDYTYTLVGDNGGRDFIQRHFSHDATIVSTYNSLPNVGMRSDLLRYLLLDVEGGVYTDTDTIALKPIDDWVPRDFRNQTRLIVGIEFDQRDGGKWADISHALQFCQWTIAATPGHPVFQKMISRVVRSLEDLKSTYGEIGHDSTWEPTGFEVMNSTGPAAWTDAVWEYLQETDGTLTDIRNLSSLGPPRLFGDVLVLPIDGFGMGQPHSGSTNDGSIPDGAMVKHLFGGSWRGGRR